MPLWQQLYQHDESSQLGQTPLYRRSSMATAIWKYNNNDTKQSATIISDNHTFRPSHRGWVSAVKWNKSNAYQLASSSHDGTIKLWDADSGARLLTLQGHDSEVFSVAFSPDGKRLASASGNGTVKVWDISNGTR